MSCDPPDWFNRTFSLPRLAPYMGAATRHDTHAVDQYRWNLQVSEAFYPALSCLEISLRNALHTQLKVLYNRPDWWAVAPLEKDDEDMVRRATADAWRRKRAAPTADDIVAELSFGFWVSLVSRRYDRHLWVPALHKAFPHYRGKRKELHDNLDTMRRLRNRIMHHEPIHHRHLEADHAKICRLLGYIGPDVVAWLREFDRAPEVLAVRPGRR
jgi:hypothetical protein